MSEKQSKGKHEAWQAVKFTLFSISAGVIQIGTWALMRYVFGWAPWVSYLISLILSVLWNFTFNRKYTFRSDADMGRSMRLVFYFYLVFTPLSTLWTAWLTGENPWIGKEANEQALLDPLIVQAGTMLINFVTEFLYQKFVVYRNSIDTNERARKEKEQDE